MPEQWNGKKIYANYESVVFLKYIKNYLYFGWAGSGFLK